MFQLEINYKTLLLVTIKNDTVNPRDWLDKDVERTNGYIKK